MDNKTISVCMATYNGAPYIKDQALSILQQMSSDDEFLISDDGSTDDTIKIIHSLSDPRIKLLHGPKKGAIKNFEYVLSQAKGEYIILSDQDDVWLDGRVDLVRSALISTDLILCDVQVVDKELKTIFHSLFFVLKSKTGFFRNLYMNSYIGCAMAFRREVLSKSLPFPSRIPMHDWWIGLIAESCFRVAICNQRFVKYRRHDNNVSVTSHRSKNSLLKKISMRLYLLYKVFTRKYL